MKKVYSLILILFLCINAKAQTWDLVWSDEFDGPSIDRTNWTYDIGAGGWGNQELEYYTDRTDNAKTEDGFLLIIAQEESYSGSDYTSARLKTKGLRSFKYGKIEARIKNPAEQGIWPAFWMLGENIDQVNWPKCGEFDIMEHINKENKNYATMHWDNNGYVSSGSNTPCDQSKFHVYSVEWDEDSIKWFLDGNKYFKNCIKNNVKGTDEFHLPFFLILNIAVGGRWPGNPISTTAFPDTMYVDYVRVYQKVSDVKSIEGKIPDNFSLLQNYPNPFNPVTTIAFNIPVQSHVSLKVFNALGKEVSTLVNKELTAGRYEQQWDAGGLPSGVYFYRLQAGSFVETRKLLLMK